MLGHSGIRDSHSSLQLGVATLGWVAQFVAHFLGPCPWSNIKIIIALRRGSLSKSK